MAFPKPNSPNTENQVSSTSTKTPGSKISQDRVSPMGKAPKGSPVKPMAFDNQKISPAHQIMRAVAKASNAAVTKAQNAHSDDDANQDGALSNQAPGSTPPKPKANFKANNSKAKAAGNGKSRYNSTAPDQDDIAVQKDKKSPYDTDFS